MTMMEDCKKPLQPECGALLLFLDLNNISEINPKYRNYSSFNNKIKSNLNKLFY